MSSISASNWSGSPSLGGGGGGGGGINAINAKFR